MVLTTCLPSYAQQTNRASHFFRTDADENQRWYDRADDALDNVIIVFYS